MIPYPESKILDPGSIIRIKGPRSWILDPRSQIQDPCFWIQDPGWMKPVHRMIITGSWILAPPLHVISFQKSQACSTNHVITETAFQRSQLQYKLESAREAKYLFLKEG